MSMSLLSRNNFHLSDPTDTISFNEEIIPIFNEQSCNVSSCHGGTRQPDLRENNAYNSISSGFVTPFEPNDSPIYTKASPSGNSTWLNIPREQSALVKQWIEQGALDN